MHIPTPWDTKSVKLFSSSLKQLNLAPDLIRQVPCQGNYKGARTRNEQVIKDSPVWAQYTARKQILLCKSGTRADRIFALRKSFRVVLIRSRRDRVLQELRIVFELFLYNANSNGRRNTISAH